MEKVEISHKTKHSVIYAVLTFLLQKQNQPNCLVFSFHFWSPWQRACRHSLFFFWASRGGLAKIASRSPRFAAHIASNDMMFGRGLYVAPLPSVVLGVVRVSRLVPVHPLYRHAPEVHTYLRIEVRI